tara:strand:+ start:631 stop:1359 length:729 start_codon:yes stop_codon:yes gene_type:complete
LSQDDESGRRVLEDVLDEVLSFNYRSLRTLRDIFLRPGAVARSFLSGDRDTYTPPMRVWFGVVSWMFLLSIIWGGFGEVIIRAFLAMGQSLDQIIIAGRRDMVAMTNTVSAVAGTLSVPITSAFILIGIPILRRFRPRLSLITATQCYFIPVSALAVSSTLFLLLSTFDARALLYAGPVNFVLVFLVAYPVIRAGFADSTALALLKTALLATVIFILSMLANIVTFMLAIRYALEVVHPAVI